MNKRRLLTLVIAVIACSSVSASAQRKGKGKPKTSSVGYLLQGSIAVNTYHFQPFSLGKTGKVWGRFEARGGSRNDVFCYIVDEDGYVNLRNGNQAQTFYNSGRVTIGNIAVNLPRPGKYYLVFYNDALFSNKTVYGTIRYSPVSGY